VIPGDYSYKNSQISWLGAIPSHWEVKKGKFIFSPIKRIVGDEHTLYKILSLTLNGVVERDISSNDGLLPGSHSTYQVVSKNDLVFKLIDLENVKTSRVGIVPQKGIMSSAYIILQNKTEALSKYLFYYYMSLYYRNVFNGLGQGVRSSLNTPDLLQMQVILPTVLEQKTIVEFLDLKIPEIDNLILKKMHMYNLLQEHRQAIISESVTRSLDLDAPIKDSGIEWLGNIPRQWNTTRLKFIAEVRSGVTKGRDLSGKDTLELPYMRVANVQDGYLDLSEVATIIVAKDEIERYSLKNGDVLMNEGGDFDKLGRGTKWSGEIEPCLHQNHVFAVRPHNISLSDWINLYTSSTAAKQYFISKSKQTTNLASISSNSIKELPVPIPPDGERQKVLEYITRKTKEIESIMCNQNEQIEKLREYRQSLITEVVTGKIDVRGWKGEEVNDH
jgi:type I restriction enzyme, S subunit